VSAAVRLVTAAGPDIGHGHLSRALSLAEAQWPEDIRLELEVDPSVLSQTEIDRAAASGVKIVSSGTAVASPGVVVIDRPDPTDAADPFAANPRVVFDDVEAFTGHAEIVVQPSAERWHGAADAGRVLAGYRWVPIGAAWRQRIAAPTDAGPVRDRSRPSVLVCFGGSDPAGVTGRLSPIVGTDPRWSATIVVGPGYRGERPPGVDIRSDPADLPDLVCQSDLALLSAGTIKFEVAALARPALLLGVADDQRYVGPAFAATGAARWIGDGRTVEPEGVRATIAATFADPGSLRAMSRAARSVIDGRGGDRLAAEIVTLLA
jgi:spore coat polysaccharide biosynthesis predicted glycosyltransferase SpsG